MLGSGLDLLNISSVIRHFIVNFLSVMAFGSIVRAVEKSPLTRELTGKLNKKQSLLLNGIPRLPKGIVSSGLARAEGKNLLLVCPTLEDAGRWAAQLEAMGWQTVNFYPTSEASPMTLSTPNRRSFGVRCKYCQLSVIGHQLLMRARAMDNSH